jgi:hypothetical protein
MIVNKIIKNIKRNSAISINLINATKLTALLPMEHMNCHLITNIKPECATTSKKVIAASTITVFSHIQSQN